MDLKIEISHTIFLFSIFSLLEGVNLLVSSGTASAIAGDRLRLVKRKTARQDDTKVWCIIISVWSWNFKDGGSLKASFLAKNQHATIFKKILQVMTVCQKLGVILESKVVQK